MCGGGHWNSEMVRVISMLNAFSLILKEILVENLKIREKDV